MANIYKIMLGKIFIETSNKWNEKMNLEFTTFAIRRSFNKISIIEDMYLRYIQFRTLHRRFYTNNILYKIGIKDSEICGLCKGEKDSNEHMLILCDISNALWSNVETWIREIGIDEYNIRQEKKILGELDGVYCVNAIILNTKILHSQDKRD